MITIERKNKKVYIPFSELTTGHYFERATFNNYQTLFLKTIGKVDGFCNAVDLDTGCVVWFNDYELVKEVDVTVTIE